MKAESENPDWGQLSAKNVVLLKLMALGRALLKKKVIKKAMTDHDQ